MSTDLPSIKDLLSGDSDEEESTTARLKSKIEEIGLKKKEELVKKRAEEKNLPYINLVGFAIGPEALKTIPLDESRKLGVICFLLLEGNVRFGAINPEDSEVQKITQKIGKELHAKTELYLISKHGLELALKIYERLPKKRERVGGVTVSEEQLKKFTAQLKNLDDFNEMLKTVSTTDLVTLIIAAAVKLRASDIHMEPSENKLLIRFRIDGILHDITKLEKEKIHLIISRIKLLSGLKLNVTDTPQDGRFSINLATDRIDVRASSLPTHEGEALTLRLLMASSSGLKLDELGFNKETLQLIEKRIKKPSGMIVTTGPTGSGKTTTLYAVINKLNNPETKIITIEDPIEYQLHGISQSQVDPDKNYTFAQGLKSLVRQDPDVLMVGEIRDLATTEIAIQAALTGHLLLTTLHTNEAAGAIARLLSLGAKPFLLAPALDTIIGQRLLRRLCEECKKPQEPPKDDLDKIKNLVAEWPSSSAIKTPDIEKTTFYTAKGCDKCQGFGYWDRIGIFEILTISKKIKDAIIAKETAEHQITALATKQGMITIAQDGLLKAMEGTTSVEEVFRVTG